MKILFYARYNCLYADFSAAPQQLSVVFFPYFKDFSFGQYAKDIFITAITIFIQVIIINLEQQAKYLTAERCILKPLVANEGKAE